MRRTARASGAAGFSLIEVLVATLIFFIIAIGIIPLFSRAILSNKAGADATTISHFGLSRLEELTEPPFNSAIMAPASGVQEYYSKSDRVWKAGSVPPAGDPGFWIRSTSISQHSLSDLEEDGVLDDPLPPDADPIFIHIKQIEVDLSMIRDPQNPLGRRRDLDLRTIRPF